MNCPATTFMLLELHSNNAISVGSVSAAVALLSAAAGGMTVRAIVKAKSTPEQGNFGIALPPIFLYTLVSGFVTESTFCITSRDFFCFRGPPDVDFTVDRQPALNGDGKVNSASFDE